MNTLRKLSAAALTITVLATSSIAASSDALAKGKRGPKFGGGNPMMAMMMGGGGGGGNPMAMLAKNPAMMMMAMMMMQKMASGGGMPGGMGGFGPPGMSPMAMFGAPPMGSPFGQ